MLELRNFEREGNSVRYSIYDDRGNYLRSSHFDATTEIAEARRRHISLRHLIELKEAVKDAPAPEITVLPAIPDAPIAKDHRHEEFAEVAEHDHPHTHDNFQTVAQALQELRDRIADLNELIKKHVHPQYEHEHLDLAPLLHGHPFNDHQHPIQIHDHPFMAHEHVHEHEHEHEHEHPHNHAEYASREHPHPFMVHDHPPQEHEHSFKTHDHPLREHDHPHQHPEPALPPHEHPGSVHEHPHTHPEIWGEFPSSVASTAPEGHLHRFDTVHDDGVGIRCGICGLPKSEVIRG